MENTNQKGETLQTTDGVGVTETQKKINQTCPECGDEFQNEIDNECLRCGYGKQTSKINGLSSIEERLVWCEEYIKILLDKKDESEAMHILDGKDISEMKQRLAKLEENY